MGVGGIDRARLARLASPTTLWIRAKSRPAGLFLVPGRETSPSSAGDLNNVRVNKVTELEANSQFSPPPHDSLCDPRLFRKLVSSLLVQVPAFYRRVTFANVTLS